MRLRRELRRVAVYQNRFVNYRFFMFKASLDRLSKWITACVVVLLLAPIIIIGFAAHHAELWALLPMVMLLVGLLGATYLYSPKAYSINDEHIIIHRIAGPFYIPRKEIQEIQSITKSELGVVWRTFGNGGMFGYTGYFSSRTIGSMRWFVTQRKNYVLITLIKGKKYLLSPDDPEAFLAALA